MSDRDIDELAALARLRADLASDPAVVADARVRLLDRIEQPSAVTTLRSRRRWMPAAAAAASVAALAAGSAALAAHHGAQHSTQPAASGPSHHSSGRPATKTAPAAFEYITTHSWALSETSLADRDIWFSTEGTAEQWVPSDWSQTWYWHDHTGTATHFLSDADRAYMQEHAPEQLQPSSDSYSGKGGVESDVGTRAQCTGECDPPSGWNEMRPSWIATLPTDPSALRASVYAAAQQLAREAQKYHKADDADSQAFEYLSELLAAGYLPADLQSAVYQVATTIPGVTTVADETNLDGVHGVGLSRLDSLGDARTDLMFTAPGGTYIGDRSVVVAPNWADDHGSTGETPVPTTTVPVGTVIQQDAVRVGTADAAPSLHPTH